ncbi:MAG: transglycosylase SLT domain-containing protein [Acetobacteraceae bacterium]|nr:transglycosylase SLT domain-containing protein [Acetobacteraceae bacterium]
MRALFLTGLLLLSLIGRAAASLGFGPPDPPGLLCRQAIVAAERANAIPAHLLAAIGRVESGRRDPVSGALHPWPWTINAEGEGQFFETKMQALTAVKALQARGVRSIDVGCLQVNLMHHPNAFATLEQAFDPHANADYAARFLRQLFGQSSTWPKATALYHSATPELGEPYQKQVMAVWPEEMLIQTAEAPSALANAWSATTRAAIPPFPHGPVAHIIPLGRGPDGTAPPGRDLASYRAAPILLSNRALARPAGG